MEEETQLKWEGQATAEVKVPADKVWPFLEDFYNIHRWIPNFQQRTQVTKWRVS